MFPQQRNNLCSHFWHELFALLHEFGPFDFSVLAMPPKKCRTNTAGKPATTSAKSKAKAKARKQVVGNEEEVGAAPLGSEQDGGSQRSNAGDRRDLKEKVGRCINRKLSHIDPQIIKLRRSKTDKLSVSEYIKRALQSKQIFSGRISITFWNLFWEEFDFDADLLELLEEPPADEQQTDKQDLLEAMKMAVMRNPADRRPGALEDLLASCPPMTRGELFAVLQCVQPGPCMSREHSGRLIRSLCSYFARWLPFF